MVCLSSQPCLMLSLLQGDDGPDVRGGSGDILLVHATETDRKGMAASTAVALCPTKGITWPCCTVFFPGKHCDWVELWVWVEEATSVDPDPVKAVPGRVLS